MHKPLSLVVSVLGMVVLLSQTLHAADSPSPPTTKQLFDQLGSSSFAERKQAREMLRARGPDVLSALRRALGSSDAEVRRSAQELIVALEAVAALRPKHVTLEVKRQPLSAVLGQIEKQTGYRLHIDDEKNDPLCDGSFRDVPFWEAVERLVPKTGLSITANALEEGIRLKPAEVRSPFVTVSGPFRLELMRIHEDRDFDFTRFGKGRESGAHDHRLSLTIRVLAEPRFILLAVDNIQVKAAQDEDQKPLVYPIKPRKPTRNHLDIGEALRGDFQHEAAVLLQRFSTKARTIRVLRGVLLVRVVVQRKRVVVTENLLAAKGKKVKIGDDELTITRAELYEDDGRFELALHVPPREPGVRWLWHQRVIVEDARGNRRKENGSGTEVSGGEHEISLSYGKSKDPAIGPPTRLIIEDWVILRHAIPFEFRDIPLP